LIEKEERKGETECFDFEEYLKKDERIKTRQEKM
jgi:hypothetical protein